MDYRFILLIIVCEFVRNNMLFRDFKYKYLFVYFFFKYMLWIYVFFFLVMDIICDKNLWYFYDI